MDPVVMTFHGAFHMAASVLTSHVFGPAKLIFNAGGVGPAKFNIRTDPFAKYMHIYIYIYPVLSYYPHPPLYPTPPPQPHGIGGVGYEENIVCIYRYIHTCGYQDYGGKKNRKSSDSISDSTVLGNFTGKTNEKSASSRLNKSQTDIP